MTRLTNELRNDIREDAIKASFKKQNEKMTAEEHALGMKLYKNLFKKSELTLLEQIDKKWFNMDSCLRFNCGGFDLKFVVDPSVPVPNRQGSYCNRLGNIDDIELVEKAQAFAKRKEDFKNEIRKAERALSVVLLSVTTVKRLAEVWPEGKAYYSHFVDEVKNTGVPMVRVEELNQMLGLAK